MFLAFADFTQIFNQKNTHGFPCVFDLQFSLEIKEYPLMPFLL